MSHYWRSSYYALVESDVRGSKERRRYLVLCLELYQTMVSVARRRLEEAEAEQARFSRCPSAGRWDAVLCPCLLSIREAWIAFHA